MKKEAKLLTTRALNSLVIAIEQFNRPIDRGRVESVLIFLDHSFEMLLKAGIIQKGGRIREARAKQTIGFDKCIRISLTNSAIKFLTEEQALSLQALNGLRDAAQHHIVDISERHLYVHAQAAVTLFKDLYEGLFGRPLLDHLPERVLPISTRPPSELDTLFFDEVEEIKRLLAPGSRRRIDAKAKLRGLAILEGAVNGENLQPSPGDLDKCVARLRGGATWSDIFPGVASLALTSDGEGHAFSLRITKREGVPIRVVSEQEGGIGVVTIKRVNELDFYNLSLQNLSEKFGVGRNKLLEVIRDLGMQSNLEYFKCIKIRNAEYKMYTHKALSHLQARLPEIDIEKVWQRRRART